MSNPIGYLTPTFIGLTAIGKKVLLRGILSILFYRMLLQETTIQELKSKIKCHISRRDHPKILAQIETKCPTDLGRANRGELPIFADETFRNPCIADSSSYTIEESCEILRVAFRLSPSRLIR